MTDPMVDERLSDLRGQMRPEWTGDTVADRYRRYPGSDHSRRGSTISTSKTGHLGYVGPPVVDEANLPPGSPEVTWAPSLPVTRISI